MGLRPNARNSLNVEHLEARETPSSFSIYAVATGNTSLPRVQVYDFPNGTLLADFQAYEPNFTAGISVAVGDINLDGFPEVITAPGNGGGPRVRVFDGRAFRNTSGFPQAPRNNTLISPSSVLADFFAFELAQRGGCYVTSNNITGTSNAEVIVGAGQGGGPRVRIFDGAQIAARTVRYAPTQPGDVSADFFAFESTFRNGVLVSADPQAANQYSTSLVVCPGPGGAPRIRVLDASQIRTQGVSYNTTRTNDIFADFFAGSPNFRGGAFVSTADYSNDGVPDVAVGTGPGITGAVTIYSGSVIRAKRRTFTGTAIGDSLITFNVASPAYTNGVAVGSTVTNVPFFGGLLLHSYGGSGLVNRTELSRFTVLAGGGLTRTAIKTIVIDPFYMERPNPSN